MNLSNQKTDWDDMIRTITAGRCVIILGPEVIARKEGVSLHQRLEQHLGVNESSEDVYFVDDEFLFTKNRVIRRKSLDRITEFYKAEPPSELQTQLARIPFHFYLSLSPDLLLEEIMVKNEIPHQFEFYKKNENPAQVEKPTCTIPLIYNLFGSIDDRESLIFTYEDMFSFLFSVAGKYELPIEVRNELKSADTFILLGFKFDKWHMNLILSMFNLHLEPDSNERFAPRGYIEIEDSVRELYKKRFDIKFVDNHIDDFVKELFERCDSKGVLRNLDEKRESLAALLRKRIALEQFEESVKLMTSFLQDKNEEELVDELFIVLTRYRRLQRNVNRGRITKEDSEVKINQLTDSLLSIVKEIEELDE